MGNVQMQLRSPIRVNPVTNSTELDIQFTTTTHSLERGVLHPWTRKYFYIIPTE